MRVSKSTVGLAVLAAGAGAALGRGVWPRLQVEGFFGPDLPGSFALVRYEGFIHTLLAVQLFCCAVLSSIVRLGSSKSLGPNAQLAIFHDGNALVGTALAIGLHGGGALWPLAFLLLGRLLVTAAQALRLRVSLARCLVWAYAGMALLLNNASQGAGAMYWCERLLGAGSGALPLATALDSFSGVAPTHFTLAITFRYTLMRFISWALDTLSGRILEATQPGTVERAFSDSADSPRIAAVGAGAPFGPDASSASAYERLAALSCPESPHKVHAASTAGLASASWSSFFSYTLHAPTYACGPLLSAADYYQQAAAVSAGRSTTRRMLAGGALWRSVARLAAFIAFAELLRRTFFTDTVVQALLAEQPWQAWAVGYCVMAALFAQNYVPWTISRLCAGALGISTADEAPLGFLSASATPRTFWRHYHVSWYRWLCSYVYIPLGGSSAALVATLAVSALLHATHGAWIEWGIIQAAALLVERRLERGSGPLSRLHPHLRAALAQCATQTTLLVQLPLGPSLPTFLAWFWAVNLPFCALNAARLAAERCSKHGTSADALFLRQKAPKLAWE